MTAAQNTSPENTPIPAGNKAPDFCLANAPDSSVSLSDFRGNPLILAFYPADWSPVCSDQLSIYQEVLGEFERYGAQLVGISVDSVWCHRAFADARHLTFPLLADFEPKGEVSRSYRSYQKKAGMSERALYVIDGAGTIQWSFISPPTVNPGADGILRALDEMASQPASAS